MRPEFPYVFCWPTRESRWVGTSLLLNILGGGIIFL